MVTAWCENSGGLGEVAESFLKDPELRQRQPPARGMLLNNLRTNKEAFSINQHQQLQDVAQKEFLPTSKTGI